MRGGVRGFLLGARSFSFYFSFPVGDDGLTFLERVGEPPSRFCSCNKPT